MSANEVHVLLVEDNEEHRLLIERLLAASEFPKFRITAACSVFEAIELSTKPGIDVVLLDLSLPDSQGIRTFERIAEAMAAIPIVILSGINDVTLAIETVQRGAQDYLVKGHVDNRLLLRSIQYAIERKRAQAALRQAHDELEIRVRERTAELEAANARLETEIAERRRAEQQTLESNQQLLQALNELQSMQREFPHRERFLALGQMAGGIAHEFNNVLTPILGYAEHLLQHPDLFGSTTDARSYVEKIRTCAQSGARAVARVRDFAKAESGEFGAVDAGDLIESVVSLTEPKWRDEALAAGTTVGIATRIDEPASIHGNAAQLRELLTHLVFNAVNAIERRGFISIAARRANGAVLIAVEDDGRGIDDATRTACLDAGVCLIPKGGRIRGFGIVHGILQRHGGKIEITAAAERGTRVEISIPLAAAAKPAEAAPARHTVVTALRILVADDEPMVRDVIGMYLAEDQHVVETAGDGREALDKFQTGKFDVVLTDRSMPGMNGDELALAVKQLSPATPVLLLTGFGDVMNSEGECPPGIDAIVPKPFTLAVIRAALAKARP